MRITYAPSPPPQAAVETVETQPVTTTTTVGTAAAPSLPATGGIDDVALGLTGAALTATGLGVLALARHLAARLSLNAASVLA